jgi:hypothetical protein
MKITILDMIPKKDTAVLQGVSNQWLEGVKSNDYNLVDASNEKTVGNSPLVYPQVTNEWKVLNQTVINISAGAHHTHNVFNSVNRLLDMSKTFDDVDTNKRGYLKGYTLTTLFIINGYPVDASPVGDAASEITTAPVKLILTQELLMTGKVMSGAPPKKVIRSVNNYPQPATLYAEDESGNGADAILAAGVWGGYA